MPARSSQGVEILVKIGTTYTVVPGVRSASVRGIEVEAIDVTAVSNTWKEFIPGSINPGTLELEIMFDPANTAHTAIEQAATTRQALDIRGKVPTDSGFINYDAKAIVTSFGISASVDEALIANVTLQKTGEETRATGT